MSLFDTLRYPITDIYNNDELKVLPREILVIWVKEILIPFGFVPVDFEITELHLGTNIHWNLAGRCQKVDLKYRKDYEVMSKKFLTKALQEIILKHEET